MYYIFINFFMFLLMGLDKYKAIHHRYRINEKLIFLFALLGGSLGVLIGMYVFRHKTKHKSFIIGIPCIIIVQCVLFLCLFYQQNSNISHFFRQNICYNEIIK